MKLSRREKADTERIEQEASLWAIQTERSLSAGEQDAFLQWLTADPRHGKELAKQRGNWVRLGALEEWRPRHTESPNRDLLAPQTATILAWLRKAPLPRLAAMAAAAAVLILGGVAGHRMLTAPAPVSHGVISPIERRALPDGSVIELNRSAEVAVLYTANERRVRLERGEAHFQVTKKPGRPFIVSAHGVDVRALGTAFNVRLDTRAVEVLVTEGSVSLKPPTAAPAPANASTPILEAGQHTVVPLAPTREPPRISRLSEKDIEEILAWKPRMLDFTDVPLENVVREFNRRNAPVRITIADQALGALELSASLRSDNVEGFIHLLEVGFGVHAERSGDKIRLTRK